MIFQEKYSINCPQVFIWLPLILEILGNMCTVITCFPPPPTPPPPPLVDEVIRVFQGERRSIFHYFEINFSGQKLSVSTL